VSSPADRGRSKQVGLDPERLARRLADEFPAPGAYWVAFSGGLDSTVLLYALAEHRERLPAPLRAIHVDHGLHAASTAWAAHCEQACRALAIPLTRCSVDAHPQPGDSPEAAAREARYEAMRSVIGARGMLLTAHHRDDQAETVLLQLMRAGGVAGLAAMPRVKPFGEGWHARPLLDQPREALRQWALDRSLGWVEDPSNAQIDADRNFLRHRILPSLGERWPAATDRIAKTAGNVAAALGALREQADDDLAHVRVTDCRLDRARLGGLSRYRQHAVLLHWLKGLKVEVPSSGTLNEVLDQLLRAAEDREPCLDLGGRQLRRYAGEVWLVETPPADPSEATIPWPRDTDRLVLPYGSVKRVRRPLGIAPEHWAEGRVEIRFRHPGFACRPAGRVGRRSLKELAQVHGIPPWQRAWLPLLFIDERPAAVANCCVCEPFSGVDDGWWIEWSVPSERES